MKFSLHIDKTREEELIIFAHEDRPVFSEIQQLLCKNEPALVGYEKDSIVILPLDEVACFISDDDKVFALLGTHRYLIKKRLYQIAEVLDSNYIRINQSCIANKKQISRFTVTVGGSLAVIFRNGHKDFVSRRELKNVKERMGIL